MSRQRKIPYLVATFALCAAAAAAGADKTEAAANTPASPTKVLKAVTYTGPMALQVVGRPDGEGGDHSLSPYLYVAGGDPQRDQVPLKKTWAEVDIAGVIAAVKVHQIFENTGSKAIEAVYVFPASTRAAVHAMRMKIGVRTVEAKIEKKAEARQQYEAAKQAGQRASLLEQERPNVFTMNVANIMPGDRIEVELDYSELVVPEDSTYEFVYPTVVGPRYAGGADAKADQWMANPHLPAGQAEPYAWDLKVHLQTGIGLKEVSSPSHKIAVSYAGPSTADIKIDQKGGGNKDFVLRYRLAGDKIETGLLQYEEPGSQGRPSEKFFALLVEPPKRPALADIPGREYIFVLDVSGSMHGFPIDTTKELMRNLLPKLRPTDHFNLVFFSGANYTWSPKGSRPATEANIREGMDKILKENGSGGTELMGGLEAAYAIPAVGKGVSRTVLVVTDGYVGVEAKAFRFIREHLDEANLFAFGIGSSVNRALIEGMARAGLGEPFVVLGPQKAKAEADKLREMIERPVLTDIRIAFGDSGAYEVAPEKVPDLLALRPLLIYGKYRGDRPTKIEITGRTGRGAWQHSVDLRPADARKENQALRALWARKWVEVLEDELHLGGGKPVEDAITNLGLFYNLLTPFTSFVAVDSEIANRGGVQETVCQPLPMPEGVSNYAVASGMRAAPAGALSGGGAVHKMRLVAPKAMAEEMAAAPVMAAPPPEPMGRGGLGAADKADKKEAEHAKGKAANKPASDKDDAKVCSCNAKVDKAENVGDTQALARRVETAARANACGLSGEVKLRVSVDRTGKITKVVVLAGRREIGQKLIGKLTGATSATVAGGQAAAGTVELTVTVR
jgi:Ca-activated chloride channel homolog